MNSAAVANYSINKRLRESSKDKEKDTNSEDFSNAGGTYLQLNLIDGQAAKDPNVIRKATITMKYYDDQLPKKKQCFFQKDAVTITSWIQGDADRYKVNSI